MAKLILSMTNRIMSSISGMFYSPEKEDVATVMARMLSQKN